MLTAIPQMADSAAVALRKKTDALLVKYDGWFLVLLAVLMTLAFTILGALAIWCVTSGNGTFSGNWEWGTNGVSIWVECV